MRDLVLKAMGHTADGGSGTIAGRPELEAAAPTQCSPGCDNGRNNADSGTPIFRGKQSCSCAFDGFSDETTSGRRKSRKVVIVLRTLLCFIDNPFPANDGAQLFFAIKSVTAEATETTNVLSPSKPSAPYNRLSWNNCATSFLNAAKPCVSSGCNSHVSLAGMQSGHSPRFAHVLQTAMLKWALYALPRKHLQTGRQPESPTEKVELAKALALCVTAAATAGDDNANTKIIHIIAAARQTCYAKRPCV